MHSYMLATLTNIQTLDKDTRKKQQYKVNKINARQVKVKMGPNPLPEMGVGERILACR